MTFWDNDAGSKIHLLANPGQDVASGQAGRQSPGAGQPAVPAQPYEGSLGALPQHFHFLSVLAGKYDDTVRNIDIDRAGYLRHSFIAGFPTERVPKMPLSGVTFGRPGLVHLQGARRHDDGCVHPPIAYQLVTLSGTGVSVLD